MYFDAEYGQSAPMNLIHAILLYGSESKIRLATVHQPVNDPQGGPPQLDAGEPLTRDFLELLVRGLGSELPAAFLPGNVLIYSTSPIAWWEHALIPDRYHRVTLQMSWDEWAIVLNCLAEGPLRERLGRAAVLQKELNRTHLQESVAGGAVLPGVRLVRGHHVRIS